MRRVPRKSPTSLLKPVPSHKLQIIIITGLAGAGKSTALNAFEDMGYYAIDNLPVFLLKELQAKAGTEHLHNRKVALVMDCRDPSFLPSFTPVVMQSSSCIAKEILFLDCDEEVLLRRFSQLRRQHPLASEGTIREAIVKEKMTLQPLLSQATRIIDTSRVTPHELARQLRKIYGKQESADRFVVNLMSFGFKHGPSPVRIDECERGHRQSLLRGPTGALWRQAGNCVSAIACRRQGGRGPGQRGNVFTRAVRGGVRPDARRGDKDKQDRHI